MPLVLAPPYVLSNRMTLFPARVVPHLAIDDFVPFIPDLGWIYLGLFPLMWLAILAQANAEHAKRFVMGAACCAWEVSLLFAFFPTSYPRPVGTRGIHAVIAVMDTDRNACPSLHGTYAAYSAAWMWRAARTWWGRWSAIAAAATILIATVAVRQHGSIDLAAGIIIGLAAFWWARGRDSEAVEVGAR